MKTYPPSRSSLFLWLILTFCPFSLRADLASGLGYFLPVGSLVTATTKKMAKQINSQSSWPKTLQTFFDTYSPVKIPVKALLEKNLQMVLVNFADQGLLESTHKRSLLPLNNHKYIDQDTLFAYQNWWKGATKAYHMYEAARLLTEDILPNINPGQIPHNSALPAKDTNNSVNATFTLSDDMKTMLEKEIQELGTNSDFLLASNLDKEAELLFAPQLLEKKATNSSISGTPKLYSTTSRLYRTLAYIVAGYGSTAAAQWFAGTVIDKASFMKLLPSWLRGAPKKGWVAETGLADLIWKMTLIDVIIIMSINIEDVFYNKVRDPESWFYPWVGFSEDEPQSKLFKSAYAFGTRVPHVQDGLTKWGTALNKELETSDAMEIINSSGTINS
jgi:hypothetical protein